MWTRVSSVLFAFDLGEMIPLIFVAIMQLLSYNPVRLTVWVCSTRLAAIVGITGVTLLAHRPHCCFADFVSAPYSSSRVAAQNSRVTYHNTERARTVGHQVECNGIVVCTKGRRLSLKVHWEVSVQILFEQLSVAAPSFSLTPFNISNWSIVRNPPKMIVLFCSHSYYELQL